MTQVSASVELAVPAETVWEVVMDPHRLEEWVSIHRRLDHVDPGPLREGFSVDQTLGLAGAHFRVHWTLKEWHPPSRACWAGTGPGGSSAATRYEVTVLPNGNTRFDYHNDFKLPGGRFGLAAGRVFVLGLSQREADRSLQQLCDLLESKTSKHN